MRSGHFDQSKSLIIVAHPDDEVLFMGGHILKHKAVEWDLLCVTDANGGGRSEERMQELDRSCKELGVKNLGSLGYPDIFNKRLDWEALQGQVSPLLKDYDRVWTHGPLGEYGHVHHQDISRAVHEAAAEVTTECWSFAYNSKPELVTELDTQLFGRKLSLLVNVYGKEMNRFMNLLSCSYAEAFARLGLPEVRSIHDFLVEKIPIKGLLPHFGMLRPWIEEGKYDSSLEAFFRSYFDLASR